MHCNVGSFYIFIRFRDCEFFNQIIHSFTDTDVIIWEGDPSDPTRKPPEMYTLIENFCLGTRRLEIFGRASSSLRRGWVTVLGQGQEEWLPPPVQGGGTGTMHVDGDEGGEAIRWERESWENGIKELANGGKSVVPMTSDIDALRPKSPFRPGAQGGGGSSGGVGVGIGAGRFGAGNRGGFGVGGQGGGQGQNQMMAQPMMGMGMNALGVSGMGMGNGVGVEGMMSGWPGMMGGMGNMNVGGMGNMNAGGLGNMNAGGMGVGMGMPMMGQIGHVGMGMGPAFQGQGGAFGGGGVPVFNGGMGWSEPGQFGMEGGWDGDGILGMNGMGGAMNINLGGMNMGGGMGNIGQWGGAGGTYEGYH